MGKKVIIIGGGVAGLSAGIYAQMNGFDSIILEQDSRVGGLCTAWYRKGYRFDYSIQWLVGTRYGTFNDLYKETHLLTEDVEVIDPKYHTLTHLKNGKDFLIYTDIGEWQEYLIANAPEDEKSIRRMCRHMDWSKGLEPFDVPPPLRTPFHYLRALHRNFWSLITLLRFKNMSCSEYFRKLHFKSAWIQEGLVNNYKNDAYSVIALLLMLSWYTKKNAGYPIGGSLGVAQRLEKRYLSLGGKILAQHKVKEILVQNDQAVGVLLEDGERMMSDYVVSAADGHTTLYQMLHGKYFTPKMEKAYKNWTPFSSIVQISMGVDALLKTDYPVQVTLYKRQFGKTGISHSYRMINYGYDPSIVPEGKSAIVIRFESPYEVWKEMTPEEYAAEKEMIAAFGREVVEHYYPNSSDKIEVLDVATPLTTVRYTGVWKGSCQGFLPTRENISKQLEMTIPKLKNFYMAGQWLFPGGGIPPSMQSGKWAIQLICKNEKKKFVCYTK